MAFDKHTRRMAGYDDDQQRVEAAMGQDTKRRVVPPQQPSTLGEARYRGELGFAAARPGYRTRERIRVVEDVFGDLLYTVNCVAACLDPLRYEETAPDAVEKIVAGPLAQILGLTKAVGFSISSYFRERSPYSGGEYGKCMALPYNGLDSEGLRLRGAVAAARAIGAVVAPAITADTKIFNFDLAAWNKAWPAFDKGIDSRVDVLLGAIAKVQEAYAAADLEIGRDY